MIRQHAPNAFTKRQISRLSEQVLRDAAVAGERPTPMGAVLEAAGISEIIDISDRGLPQAVVAKKPSRIGRVLGAVFFSERTVFIDRDEPDVRVQFTDAHEAIHALCPWHEPTLRFDDLDTLAGRTAEMVESEANYGAGHLIFQGGRFHRRALKEQVSISTPLELASEYRASRHATLHFYVEEHPDAVALLIAGRYRRFDNTLPIWRSVESREFTRRFGRLEQHLPGEVLSVADESQAAPLAEIINRSRLEVHPPSTDVTLLDAGGSPQEFVAEAFFNQTCHFVLVVERKARRLGRRIRLASCVKRGLKRGRGPGIPQPYDSDAT